MSRAIMMSKAKKGDLNPKNTMLQEAFNNNWNPKWYNPVFTHLW